MLSCDIATGKPLLKDHVNAIIGFEELAVITNKSPNSLMRMLSVTGNLTASNVFSIIHRPQEKEDCIFIC